MYNSGCPIQFLVSRADNLKEELDTVQRKIRESQTPGDTCTSFVHHWIQPFSNHLRIKVIALLLQPKPCANSSNSEQYWREDSGEYNSQLNSTYHHTLVKPRKLFGPSSRSGVDNKAIAERSHRKRREHGTEHQVGMQQSRMGRGVRLGLRGQCKAKTMKICLRHL